MTDLTKAITEHKNLSEDAQKSAGKAIAGAMDDDAKNFLKKVHELIESGEIDVHKPETFLQKNVYDNLSQEQHAKVDLALVNLADLMRHIEEFYRSKKTPDESPHLETMILHASQITKKIEDECGDVFKF